MKGDEMERKAQGKTILLVEDDLEIATLYQLILEARGYRVINAVDGEDGISKFIENKDQIQLVVTDVLMPKKNGNELYEEIKRMKSSIKVIFTSAHSNEITKELKRGSLAYLQKPYSPENLLEKIRELLDEK
jgi:two-component system, cell cycle sensor histidine kinase and response regulator CckA